MSKHIIYNFNKTSNIKNWVVVDDIVMGGKSIGSFELSEEGNGIFKGHVSLENNGGFSSVKYKFSKIYIKNATVLILRIKGDSKNYQFRIKANSLDIVPACFRGTAVSICIVHFYFSTSTHALVSYDNKEKCVLNNCTSLRPVSSFDVIPIV